MKTAAFLIPVVMLAALPQDEAHARAVNRSASENRAIFRDFVRCVLAENRALSVDYALNQGTRNLTGEEQKAESERYRTLSSAACARKSDPGLDSLTAASIAFSGVVAEEVLRGHEMKDVEAVMSGAPALSRVRQPSSEDYRPDGRLSRERFMQELPRLQSGWAFDVVTECAVRKAPGLSRSVFETDQGGSAEAAALSAVLPHVSDCLPSATLKIDPDLLRYTLARNYLRLAVAAVPSFKEKLI